MRHRKKKYLKFWWRDRDHRKALRRNLLTQLFLHKRIITTIKKAKYVAPFVDRLINVVNTKDTMNAIRYVMKHVYTKESSKELFENIAPKFKGKQASGCTRIVPLKYRIGDNAKMVLLEIV